MNKDKPPKLVAPQRGAARKPARRRPPKQPAPKRGGFGGFLRMIWRFIWWALFWVILRVSFVIFLILAGVAGYYLSILPDASALMDDRQHGSVTMLDRNGDIFAWRGDQFGGVVTPETISPNLRNAVIATEDKRFYTHIGLSPRGIAGAIRTNLREGRTPLKGHGGSTITQQVAKQVFFAGLPTIERKLREVPMALAMEIKYTKNEILAIYLNRVYLGNGSYGFAAASQRYFGRPATNVNVAQAAMLAGLLKAPSTSNPIRNFDRAYQRANLIIGLMQDQGYITAQQAQYAREHPARLSKVAAKKAGGYFADWVLDTAPEFIIKDANADVIIQTTYDPQIQAAAEGALSATFETLKSGSRAQGAVVVMSPDGAVRAIVGGRKNEFAGAFNRATQALRQTGSAFKPFVYATALEGGFRYDDIIEDRPIEVTLPGQPNYAPRNYDNEYMGPITLTQALAESRNTAAVALSEQVGRTRVRALARDFGVQSDIPVGPSLALGAGEATLLEMVGAYGGIANLGRSVTPYGVLKLTIQGEPEPLLHKESGAGQKVINDFAARQLVYMMRQVIETGTGKRAKLPDRQAAGKTGTTQGARDAWFIGFTADYVAGVWMGYDDNTRLSGVTGGGLPAEIWRETMIAIHQDLPPKPLQALQFPDDLIGPQEAQRNVLSIEEQIANDLKATSADSKTTLGDMLRRIFN